MKLNLWQILGVVLLVGGVIWYISTHMTKPTPPPAAPTTLTTQAK